MEHSGSEVWEPASFTAPSSGSWAWSACRTTGQGNGGGGDYLFCLFVYLLFTYTIDIHFSVPEVGESQIKTLADPVSAESPFLLHGKPPQSVLTWGKALIISVEQILEDGG